MDFMTILSNILGELFAPTTAAYALAAIGLNIHFGMSGLMNMVRPASCCWVPMGSPSRR